MCARPSTHTQVHGVMWNEIFNEKCYIDMVQVCVCVSVCMSVCVCGGVLVVVVKL